MPSAWTKPDSEKSIGKVASRGVPSAPEDFSLALGGPLYQLYLRTRLARPSLDLVWRRAVAIPLICWFPPFVLALATGHAFGTMAVPFLLSVGVHTRFLVALPLLIASELIVH